jgi:hypothetical protein
VHCPHPIPFCMRMFMRAQLLGITLETAVIECMNCWGEPSVVWTHQNGDHGLRGKDHLFIQAQLIGQ